MANGFIFPAPKPQIGDIVIAGKVIPTLQSRRLPSRPVSVRGGGFAGRQRPITAQQQQQQAAAIRRAAAVRAAARTAERGKATNLIAEGNRLLLKSSTVSGQIGELDRKIDTLQRQVNQAQLLGLPTKARKLNTQINQSVTRRNNLAGQFNTLQQQGVSKINQAGGIVKREGFDIPVERREVAREETRAKAEDIPRFAIDAGAGRVPLPEFVRQEFQPTREEAKRRVVDPFFQAFPEITPAGLLAPFVTKGPARQPDIVRGGVAITEVPFSAAGFGFRGITQKGIVEPAERLVGKPFELTFRVPRETGEVISRVTGVPKGVVLEEFKIGKEEVGVAAEVAGQLALFAALARTPAAVRAAKNLDVPGIGERGELQIIERRGKKVKIGEAKVEIELEPRVTRALVDELKESARLARREIARPPIAPGEVRIEPSRELTIKLAKELGRTIKEVTPTRFKPVSTERLARSASKSLNELFAGRGEKVVQVVVRKPAPAAIVRAAPPGVQAISRAEAQAAKSILTEVKAAQRARLPAAKAVREVAGIQESAIALGLAAGRRREQRIKLVEGEISLPALVPREAAVTRTALETRLLISERERVSPISIRQVLPISRPRARVAEGLRIEQAFKDITIPRQISAVSTKAIQKIAEKAVPREAVRITPRVDIRRVTRIDIPRPREPRRRVPEPIRPIPRLPRIPTVEVGAGRRRVTPVGEFGFALEVRRKGVFVPAFPGIAFTEKSAKALAQQLVGGTPLASFRIRPTVGKARRVTGVPEFRPEQFRPPVKRGIEQIATGVFVEKTRFRIDTAAEKLGITAKGLAAIRARRRVKKKKKKKKSKGKRKGKK